MEDLKKIDIQIAELHVKRAQIQQQLIEDYLDELLELEWVKDQEYDFFNANYEPLFVLSSTQCPELLHKIWFYRLGKITILGNSENENENIQLHIDRTARYSCSFTTNNAKLFTDLIKKIIKLGGLIKKPKDIENKCLVFNCIKDIDHK